MEIITEDGTDIGLLTLRLLKCSYVVVVQDEGLRISTIHPAIERGTLVFNVRGHGSSETTLDSEKCVARPCIGRLKVSEVHGLMQKSDGSFKYICQSVGIVHCRWRGYS